MREGLFTGRKLGDYFPTDGHPAPVDLAEGFRNARRIINAMDRAALIAGYAVDFYRLLDQSAEGRQVS
jgi:hypothetical protein